MSVKSGIYEDSVGYPPDRQPLLSVRKYRARARRLTQISSPHTLMQQTMFSLIDSTIAELSEALRAKKVSPGELVQAHLARIQQLQPKLSAFTHLDPESAMAEARVAEQKIQSHEPLGRLHGIPLTVKSSIDVRGWPTPAGSLIRRNNVATNDAALVCRLRAAGAILLGNTNTPEFLMNYETDNRLQAKTSNPWNLAYSAGGSSGGEASAISSGCSVAGIGSDGGGSIRVPAHFCGICGLKPTPGRVPSAGHFPAEHEVFPWLGVVGPLARSVADLATVFAVVADRTSDPVELLAPERLGGMRIGILEEENILGHPTPGTKAAVQQAARHFAQLGFAVDSFQSRNFPELLDQALDLWWFFFGPTIAHLYRNDYRGQESQFSPMLNDYFRAAEAGAVAGGEQIRGARAARDVLQKKILRALTGVPLLLSPVSLGPAFKHGEGGWHEGSGYRATMRHSQWLNLVGLPGLAVPMGMSPEGLPIGIQLIAHPNQEELLLSAAALLERARGPWPRQL